MSLTNIVSRLESHYGTPVQASRDPLELIVLENIAYLANDTQRENAFAQLKDRVGIDPENILKAGRKTLAGIAKAGILPDVSVEKLLTVAQIAYREFNSDLNAVIKLPTTEAKKALKRFPGIGDPGVEKILPVCGSAPGFGSGIQRIARAVANRLWQGRQELFRQLSVCTEGGVERTAHRLRVANRCPSASATPRKRIVQGDQAEMRIVPSARFLPIFQQFLRSAISPVLKRVLNL